MSVSSSKKIVEDDYDYGDDVSIIDRSENVDWGTIVIKVCLGLLFIGFASGCIIYSVITSEEKIQESTNSSFFLYDKSQHCHNGTLTWRNRTGLVNDYDTVSTGITWLQDSIRQRIFHRIGIAQNDADWQVSHYVFSNHTFFVNQAGCDRLPYGYSEYLRRLGLHRISMVRSEKFAIEGEEQEVNYFEGEPSKNISIEGMHPSMVRAYSAPDNSFTYGWLYVFPQNDQETGLYQKEYWYPEMVAGVSDEGVFEELPSSCYKATP